MAYKELMEKASDSLARLVAKAAKPIYSKTKPALRKKSIKDTSDDLSENYSYISSLSKVSNKSCPVRHKAIQAEAEIPKKQRQPVRQTATPRKKTSVQQPVVRQASLKSVRKVDGVQSVNVDRILMWLNERLLAVIKVAGIAKVAMANGWKQVRRNGWSNPFKALNQLNIEFRMPRFEQISLDDVVTYIKKINVSSSKAWIKRYPIQFAGTVGVVATLCIGTLLFSEMSQAPVADRGPVGTVDQKQEVANSFSSTQTIMMEDRGVEKLDFADAVTMANVSDYSKPGYMGYAIDINGKEVGFFKERSQAQAVLEQIKDRYAIVQKDRQIVKVFFKERVSIVSGFRPVGQIQDYSASASAENYILKGSKEEQAHVVQEGETFWDIAVKNNISVDSLIAANPDITPERLQIGDELSLLSPKPLVTVCVVEKAKLNELIPYEVKYVEAKNLFKGDSKINAKGKNGERIIVADILKENGNVVARNVLSEKILSEPVLKIVSKGTKERPRTAATGKFARPIGRGASFSSDFGWRWGRRHTGVDLSCHVGTPVFAADGGTVIFSGNYQAYGKCIIVSHGNGLQTYYAHTSKLLVAEGDKVFKGQKIALSGNTGRSTGPHLHFEVRRGGTPVDPEKFLHLR